MRWSRTLTVVGAHAEGEIGNVVTGGVGPIPGHTAFDKKRYLEAHDGLRRFLIQEPRGSVACHYNVLFPSSDPRADIGYVIMEPTEYPPMSGSNTICTATVLLETGILPMTEPETVLRLEAPAGLIEVRCRCRDGKVERVELTNVPAFALTLGRDVEVAGIGTVKVDVAYGGMMFGLVDAKDLGFALDPGEAREICEIGQRIKQAVNEQIESVHPENPEIRDVSILSVRGPVRRRGRRLVGRHAVVISPGRLDRSPTGTGTSARLAVMHARRQIRRGELFVSESIIGTRFECRIVGTARVGGRRAIVNTVAGQAWITGIMQLGCDPTDPFPEGYRVGDTWMSEPRR